MHFKFCLLLYISLLFIHYSNAFNITTILNQHPSFSIFNCYLSETNVSSEINSRETITVLAVSNDDISRLSGEQHEMLKNLMRVHVVLDYYDLEKLHNLQNGTTQMTTLFQTTGRALGEQGFLKATVSKTGNVVIGSLTRGVPVGAILVNSVASEPFNISVLHISTEIVPVGMNYPVVKDSNSISQPAPTTRCTHKVGAPSHAKSSTPSPNPHGESSPEGALPSAPSNGSADVSTSAESPSLSSPEGALPSAPSNSSADAPASAESPSLLAPKLAPSHLRSPTPSSNPPSALEPPPNPTPSNPPPIVESPPKGAPSVNAPGSKSLPPGGAPPGGSANAPQLTKLPPKGAPTGAPSGGFANTPVKLPPKGATPTTAPSGGSPNTPQSPPPKSIDTPPRSPPNPPSDVQPPPKPADTHQSGSGTSNSPLVVLITIVLLCTNLIIQT